jgi:hypothetical protein
MVYSCSSHIRQMVTFLQNRETVQLRNLYSPVNTSALAVRAMMERQFQVSDVNWRQRAACHISCSVTPNTFTVHSPAKTRHQHTLVLHSGHYHARLNHGFLAAKYEDFRTKTFPSVNFCMKSTCSSIKPPYITSVQRNAVADGTCERPLQNHSRKSRV